MATDGVDRTVVSQAPGVSGHRTITTETERTPRTGPDTPTISGRDHRRGDLLWAVGTFRRQPA